MSTESGYGNSKKYGRPQHKTISHLGSDRYGQHVVMKTLSDKTLLAQPIVSVTESLDKSKLLIEITGHNAKKGDVLRIATGALATYELDIIAIGSANTFVVYNLYDIAPQAGDTAKVAHYSSTKSDADGALTTTPGPVQFIRNGAITQVLEDTVTPANNTPLPVKLTGVTGDVNITAGDINVQSSDIGPNFDAVRLGDGNGSYMTVTAGKAQVEDSVGNTRLTSIDGKTPALVGGKVPVDIGVAPLTDAQLRAAPVDVGGTVSIDNFPATQSVTVDNFPANQTISGTVNVGNFPATQQISAAALPLPAGAAAESTLAAMSAKLPAVLGQAAKASSLSAALSFENEAQLGATNEVVPVSDTATAGINGRLQRIAQRLTSLIALLPASLGQKTMAGSLAVTIASDQAALPISTSALTASYQEDLTVTDASAETINAPAGAKWCKIMTECSGGDMRIKIGGVASATSGMKMQDGRSEDFQAVGNISYIMDTVGATGKIFVIFGA